METTPDDTEYVQSRLSRISTIWPMLASAHEGNKTEVASARLLFVQRYQRAAYRYLLGATHDADAADELFQEMALRFVRGDLQRADPDKGRFRNYLKTTLSHLVVDYYRQQQKRTTSLEAVETIEERVPESRDTDAAFRDTWCMELLDRAWEKLELTERDGGPLFYSLLRYRTEHPDESSSDIALQFTVDRNLNPGLTPDNVRKLIQRARQRFADFLLDEVAGSLQNPTSDDIEQELIDLDLLRYCRGALGRREL